jgi:glycerate dehydrogenase
VRITVLDGWTLNPGDLSWAELGVLGDLTVFERTPADQIQERAAGSEVLLTNKTPISGELMSTLPNLRYIGVLATGCNVVDIIAAAARAIPVCNAAGYSNESVAQMVFAHILHFANAVAEHSVSVHAGEWVRSLDFCYCKVPQVELANKVLGIYGLGQIGAQVARIAQAFGMQVIAYTRNPARPAPAGVQWVDQQTLFAESDFLSLHCPLTRSNAHLINANTLSQMKRGAILLNTGRGGLVDERALADSLRSGHLGGAGLDVLDREPPPEDCPLWGIPNCVITPHIAWATQAARQRLMDITVGNLRAWIAGKATNDVTRR